MAGAEWSVRIGEARWGWLDLARIGWVQQAWQGGYWVGAERYGVAWQAS